MPGSLYLPEEVIEAIGAHLTVAVQQAADAYRSGSENEDTLTGQLGMALRTSTHKVTILQGEAPGVWKWSIDYSKFRSQGKGASEALLGADGIINIRIDEPRHGQKSLLFQAKKIWENDPRLLGQSLRMSTWREAACIIDYRPGEISAYRIDDAIVNRGRRPTSGGHSLDRFLTNVFLPCQIGDTDLRYDAGKRTLIWRNRDEELVSTQFRVRHRLTIKIKPPRHKRRDEVTLDIPNSEVHQHRMSVSAREMLGLSWTPTASELKASKRRLSLAYHPDQLNQLNEFERRLATARMQEIYASIKEVESAQSPQPSRARPRPNANHPREDSGQGRGSGNLV